MKYAIAYMNHMVFQHFGKCPGFLLVDIEDGKILKKDMLNANGSGHGALVALLKDANVDVLVCGGIGQGARNVLAENQIALISGANGNVDEIIDRLRKGILKDDPSGMCSHHHDGEEHNCAEHDCSHH